MEAKYDFRELDVVFLSVRKAKNLFYWLLFACFVYGGVNIYVASSALGEARQERSETTFREVRFNLVEIQSEKYHSLQTVLWFMQIGKYILGGLTLGMVFRLLYLLDFDSTTRIIYTVGLIFPCTSLFFTISVVHYAHKFLRNYGKG